MLKTLCKTHTDLGDEDIDRLRRLSETKQYTADLTGADIFIDCFSPDGAACVVVAQAWPSYGGSIYDRTVVGELAEEANEPAVFTVRETGLPARDIRAVTQENKSVRQVVVPVRNDGGALIGVLIQEKDISDSILRERKLEALSRTTEQQSELLQQYGGAVSPYAPSVSGDTTAMKEIHHRVKNNLQMVASILNIQARRSQSGEVRTILKENVSRVLSFAAIHEILTGDSLLGSISLAEVLRKVCGNIHSCTGCGDRGIDLSVEGDEIQAEPGQATSVAIVVNELVMNAVEHAFADRPGGRVTVQLSGGNQMNSVRVRDDGGGFPQAPEGLGLQLVRSIVEDKLRGRLQIQSEPGGTVVAFDFYNNDSGSGN